jgi:hypothetical protein
MFGVAPSGQKVCFAGEDLNEVSFFIVISHKMRLRFWNWFRAFVTDGRDLMPVLAGPCASGDQSHIWLRLVLVWSPVCCTISADHWNEKTGN